MGFALRQRIGVLTIGIIGGLLVLLMVNAAACSNPEPESTEDLASVTPSATRVHPSVGICDRTEHIRNAILARIDGVDDCEVTATHLSAIDGMIDLRGVNIAKLQPGDFDGLTALEVLNLRATGLTSLEAGVFDGLASLTALDLGGIYYIAYPDWFGSPYKNRLASVRKGGVCGTYIVETTLPGGWQQIDGSGGGTVRRSQRA